MRRLTSVQNCYFADVKAFLCLLLCIVLFSCGTGVDPAAADSAVRLTDSTARDRSDVNSSCCFADEKDFEHFFPDSCGTFIRQPLPSIALKCVTDTIAHSSARYGYANRKSHLVTVTLADYCTTPLLLQTDYALQSGRCKSAGTKSEFNEFDVPSSHHGFAHFDNVTRTASLVIVVDDRFLVEINDQVCENTKNVLAIYEQLPLQELSRFGK